MLADLPVRPEGIRGGALFANGVGIASNYLKKPNQTSPLGLCIIVRMDQKFQLLTPILLGVSLGARTA